MTQKELEKKLKEAFRTAEEACEKKGFVIGGIIPVDRIFEERKRRACGETNDS